MPTLRSPSMPDTAAPTPASIRGLEAPGIPRPASSHSLRVTNPSMPPSATGVPNGTLRSTSCGASRVGPMRIKSPYVWSDSFMMRCFGCWPISREPIHPRRTHPSVPPSCRASRPCWQCRQTPPRRSVRCAATSPGTPVWEPDHASFRSPRARVASLLDGRCPRPWRPAPHGARLRTVLASAHIRSLARLSPRRARLFSCRAVASLASPCRTPPLATPHQAKTRTRWSTPALGLGVDPTSPRAPAPRRKASPSPNSRANRYPPLDQEAVREAKHLDFVSLCLYRFCPATASLPPKLPLPTDAIPLPFHRDSSLVGRSLSRKRPSRRCNGNGALTGNQRPGSRA